MPAIYTADQLNTVTRLQAICGTILDQLALAQLIATEAGDKGYGSGGANVITDALLQTVVNGSAPFPALTAQNVFDAVTTITTLQTTLAATSRAGFKALERMRA